MTQGNIDAAEKLIENASLHFQIADFFYNVLNENLHSLTELTNEATTSSIINWTIDNYPNNEELLKVISRYYLGISNKTSDEASLYFAKKAVDYYPTAEVIDNFARLNIQLGREKGLKKVLSSLRGVSTSDYPILIQLGIFFLQKEKFGEAEVIFSNIIEKMENHDFPEVYGMGFALEKQGKNNKAKKMFIRAIQETDRGWIFQDFINKYHSDIYYLLRDKYRYAHNILKTQK